MGAEPGDPAVAAIPVPVVVTRPRAQADGLAAAIAAQGREVVLLPLLEIDPLPDTSELRAALARLDQYALAAFVSPNAIDAAFAHLAAWPAGVPIAVLGEGSRASLAQHGVSTANAVIVSPREGDPSDSEHLMEALDVAALAGKRVLIVRGESGRELIADAMRAAGAQVDTVAAYRRRVPALTEALAASLAPLLARPADWIITSSEALRGLFALAGEMGGAAAVAKLQQQHLIVPHARIAETAASLGATHLTLTGSGDGSLLAALQSRA
jgi:uroporphyrinogen-III synthase